ncbi:wall-associated protein [Drosophila yakuba]|uniref:Uncharacterized protein n=1 Tax=Drosophila yakuba TaxID=7245 RepID=B4PWS7_DROYA|nr:wall-associated protein [Drosophila yakuba]EDX02811.2 uncharacterized protein Dyak_GE17774 [Drosophila yakuba]
MKLLHALWLLSSLLLVSSQPNQTANSATKDAPVVANATNVIQAKVIAGSKSETGSPGAASQLVPGKDAAVLQQEKDSNKTAAAENAGKTKNLTSTDTGLPPVPSATSKPAVVQKVAKEATTATSTTSTSTTTTTTAKPATGSAIVTEGNSSTNGTATSSSNSTNTTTTKTVNATNIATTPKPKKPPVVWSTDIQQEGEDMAELEKGQDKLPTKGGPTQLLTTPPEPMVQGLTGSNLADHGDNGYVVPIVTVLLTVPLAIGVVTIMYRRFRDMWSTRHYRRMDFLVDGMYND